MNIQNTNYLEFNRDLFLCNSIRDISNGTPMPMITSDRNEVYQSHLMNFTMPFIDQKWNIYVRPLNPARDDGAKDVIGSTIGPITGSSNVIYYYKSGATGVVASENKYLNDAKFNMIKELSETKITYEHFYQNFQKYLKEYEVYVGPGEIKYIAVVSTTTEYTDGSKVIVNTPEYYSIVNGTLNWFDTNFKGQCKNYNLQTNCKKLDATDNNDTQQNQETCEICKNFQYRDWFDENEMNIHGIYAKNKDTSQEYIRSWLQTWNLGIGIILLTTGIYYQLKK